jgi:hypothetical protein
MGLGSWRALRATRRAASQRASSLLTTEAKASLQATSNAGLKPGSSTLPPQDSGSDVEERPFQGRVTKRKKPQFHSAEGCCRRAQLAGNWNRHRPRALPSPASSDIAGISYSNEQDQHRSLVQTTR